MITVKDISTNCNINNYKLSKLIRYMGLDQLLNEAARLQAIDSWDNKQIPTSSNIDVKFVKEAYLAMAERYEL